MQIILLGAPGAGKGTHSELICSRFKIPHISTGEILRDNMRDKTEIGELARMLLETGQLMPDDAMLKIMENRLREKNCANGFLLDGFPRTLPQASGLSKLAVITAVVNLQIDESLLLQRLTGRRICDKCGRPHHISRMKGPHCEKCGGELVTRQDDSEDVIISRMKIYHADTEPLIRYYQQQGLLFNVDSSLPVDEVHEIICEELAGKKYDNN